MPTRTVQAFQTGSYDAAVREAAELLTRGQIVVLPTETVYGAAAVLNHSGAHIRLRSLEPAMRTGPLVVHLAAREQAAQYLGSVSELGQRMMRKLWPGPVGLIFDVPAERQAEVARNLQVRREDLYDGSTITLRCPDHEVAMDVIARAGRPVVLRKATDPTGSAAQAADQLAPAWAEHVQLVLDAGPTRYSKPSTLIKINQDDYRILRAGVYDQRIIKRLLQTVILFVCSGNTCRSPMAEALTRMILAHRLNVGQDELEKKGITVLSAGSFAIPGARATPVAAEVIRTFGADLSRHRSRPLSVELIHEADVIFTMGRNHAQAVTALVPSASGKIVALDPDGDIEDPIGGDVALYLSLARQLQTLIEKRLAERSLP